MASIAFATHAFWRDYRVVLDPARFRMVLESHRHPFSSVLIVLNNFRSANESREAWAMAETLIDLRLADAAVKAHLVLSDETLISFGLDPSRYWNENPYFSSAQLCALLWAGNRFDYLLHMSGDVWLEKPCDWVPDTIAALDAMPEIASVNLCRNVSRSAYTERKHTETDKFWIANNVSKQDGISISDLGYLLRTNPGFRWRFPANSVVKQRIESRWPAYANPCFEMLATATIYENGKQIAALKPGPILKHKNFSSSAIKSTFYRMLGRYRSGGKYATA